LHLQVEFVCLSEIGFSSPDFISEMPHPDILEVPIKKDGEEEVLEIDLNDLIGNEESILGILLEYKSSPALFLQFAVYHTHKV
jgi:hypothetical protein